MAEVANVIEKVDVLFHKAPPLQQDLGDRERLLNTLAAAIMGAVEAGIIQILKIRQDQDQHIVVKNIVAVSEQAVHIQGQQKEENPFSLQNQEKDQQLL